VPWQPLYGSFSLVFDASRIVTAFSEEGVPEADAVAAVSAALEDAAPTLPVRAEAGGRLEARCPRLYLRSVQEDEPDLEARTGDSAAISIGGTFGTATVTVEVSQNNVNFYPLKDRNGTTISTTSAALFEFSTAAMYIRPVVTGAGATISCILTLRGAASSV
jgi:hypothetical protein